MSGDGPVEAVVISSDSEAEETFRGSTSGSDFASWLSQFCTKHPS